MCGITGWIDFRRDLRPLRPVVTAMVATMSRRGPDDVGHWVSRHAALGHRRLAVIDIAGGRQPMLVEEDDQPIAVITYSGEVYNYRELRGELRRRGHEFRTSSDTEVVLHAYLEWGESFVDRLNGMFAFGLWDTRRETLLLVRDRMGVKPLYFYPTDAGVIFGSEPKAILAHPWVRPVVDTNGLREAFAFVRTPGHAIYDGMFEVIPGELVRVDSAGLNHHRYWQLTAAEHPDDRETTVRTVRSLLDDTVERQLVSDVPLCSLLSGGLDSTAITGLAARVTASQGTGPIRSFAVDFDGNATQFAATALRETPDSPFAHEAAAWLGVDHQDIVLTSDALASREHRRRALAASDLPMSGGEMFTSLYLLFAKVREHSTVALTGEAADELFGGYRWFRDPTALAGDDFPWLGGRDQRGVDRDASNVVLGPIDRVDDPPDRPVWRRTGASLLTDHRIVGPLFRQPFPEGKLPRGPRRGARDRRHRPPRTPDA